MKRYAIFFPQFHQVKVNDLAWGFGFTDWHLVGAANAFNYWPRRAPKIGFYNLGDPKEIRKQLFYAASYGLDGFGIYHYFFSDGPEIDSTERYLLTGEVPSSFKYFLIWANENWTMRWAGKDFQLLKKVIQNPSLEDVRRHVDTLLPHISSPKYTTVGGRPLFVFYRPEFFPSLGRVISMYRQEFGRHGHKVFLGCFIAKESDLEYSRFFDCCYLFEPRLFFGQYGSRRSRLAVFLYRIGLHSLPYSFVERISEGIGRMTGNSGKAFSYKEFADYFRSDFRNSLLKKISVPVQNVISAGWNNAPRYRDKGISLETPNESQFGDVLNFALGSSEVSPSLPLLCNAWNEWSEGAAIEPCAYLGDALLRRYTKAC